jgi:uncharacterized LabA/DUF88 family protein
MMNLIPASLKLPASPQTIAFFDGQNLFRSAKRAFGYIYPNYDPKKLSQQICINQGWELKETRFYTGFPSRPDDPFWNHFWRGKFAQLKRDQVYVFSRHLRYHNNQINLPTGNTYTVRTPREKGVDVRIAVDVIRLAHRAAYDVALIFSQDQDFSEVAEEIRLIAQEQNRWIKIASAFPCAPYPYNRGIDKTDWIIIDRPTYDACIDSRDYRLRIP